VDLVTTDSMAVLHGIPLVSAMLLSYLQLACVVTVTQDGHCVNNLFNNRIARQTDSF